MQEKIKLTKEEIKLVRSRLEAMPSDLIVISLGESYTKEDLIKQLESKTGLGARIALRELDYVKTLWSK